MAIDWSEGKRGNLIGWEWKVMHRKTGDIFPSCERGDGYLAVFGVLWMVEQPQKGAVEGVWEFKYWRKKIAIESSRPIGACPILDFFF